MDQNISNNMTIASKLVSFFESADFMGPITPDQKAVQRSGQPVYAGYRNNNNSIAIQLMDKLKGTKGIDNKIDLGKPSIRKTGNPKKISADAGSNFAIRIGRVVNAYHEYVHKIKRLVTSDELDLIKETLVINYLGIIKDYGKELLDLLNNELGEEFNIGAFKEAFVRAVDKFGYEEDAPDAIKNFISSASSTMRYALSGDTKYVPTWNNSLNGHNDNTMDSHNRDFGYKIGRAIEQTNSPTRFLNNYRGKEISNPEIEGGSYKNDNDLSTWQRVCKLYMLARESAIAYVNNLESACNSMVDREKEAMANNQLSKDHFIRNKLKKAKQYAKENQLSLIVDDLGEKDICYLIKNDDSILDNVRLTDEPFGISVSFELEDYEDLINVGVDKLKGLPELKIKRGLMSIERVLARDLADMVLGKFGKNTSYFIANNKDVEKFIESDEVINSIKNGESKSLFEALKNVAAVYFLNKNKVIVNTPKHNDNVVPDGLKSPTPMKPSNLAEPIKDADSLIKNKANELGLKKPTEVSGSKEIKGTEDFKKHMELLWGMRSLPGFIDRLRKNNSFYVEYVNSKLKDNGYNAIEDLTPDQIKEIAKQLAAESTHDWVGKYLKDVQVVDGYRDSDKETSVAESILSFLDSL